MNYKNKNMNDSNNSQILVFSIKKNQIKLLPLFRIVACILILRLDGGKKKNVN